MHRAPSSRRDPGVDAVRDQLVGKTQAALGGPQHRAACGGLEHLADPVPVEAGDSREHFGVDARREHRGPAQLGRRLHTLALFAGERGVETRRQGGGRDRRERVRSVLRLHGDDHQLGGGGLPERRRPPSAVGDGRRDRRGHRVGHQQALGHPRASPDEARREGAPHGARPDEPDAPGPGLRQTGAPSTG